MHIESLIFTATAAAVAGTAATAITGDSLQIKNGRLGSRIEALFFGCKNQTAGAQQIIFPSGHDTTRNIRISVAAGINQNMLPEQFKLRFQPQEVIVPTIFGTAVAGDVEYGILGMFYEDLPGLNARLIDYETLQRRGVRPVTVFNSITALAAGTYSAAQAINAGSDLLRANTDYAVLGLTTTVIGGAITLKGPDTANARIPFLCDQAQAAHGADFYPTLSYENGLPLIPVINSANKGSTFIEAVQDENLVAQPFSLFLVELAPEA